MRNLFAYGTLMCEDIFRDVSGMSLSGEPGVLRGYRRGCIRGETYPAIVPDAGASVPGVIYAQVPDAAWDRLDRFEGELYARRSVEIQKADGSMSPADVYALKPEFIDHLGPEEWDYDDFLRYGKSAFQKGYQGYRSL